MVEFGGFDMPLQYSTIREEHIAVRTRCGLFDLSHMGEVRFSGDGALDVVQRLVTNDVARLEVGGALYGVMCNEAGGIVDDVVVYREAGGYMVVINAACRPKDVAWMGGHSGECTFEDVSDAVALLAVQGPRAVGAGRSPRRRRRRRRSPVPLHRHHGRGRSGLGLANRLHRRGRLRALRRRADAPGLWDALLDAGAADGLIPCGLGARDTLRLEAGLRLYGQDMDDNTDPYSCALGWTVKLQKGEFIGQRRAGQARPQAPPAAFRRASSSRAGRSPATVSRCSSAASPPARSPAGPTASRSTTRSPPHHWTASVPADAELSVDIRGTVAAATVVPLPFYRRPKGA